MTQFSFLTIGDKAYFHTIYYSIHNINSLYPEVNTYVYDWGFTEEQRVAFRELKNVVLVPWEKRIVDISIHFSSWRQMFRLAYGINSIRDFLSVLKLNKIILRSEAYASFLRREMFFANKPLCMLDYVENYGENFIFLDGDAAVLQRIDEVLEGTFDIGVTLREPNEISIRKNTCSVLNTGVLFFLGGKLKNEVFLNFWIRYMKDTHERFIEQSALTHLLRDFDTDMFAEYREKSVPIDEESIRIRILPCRVYNHYRSRRYGVTEQNKIVHFKSMNYRKEIFYNFLKELGLPISDAMKMIQQRDL